MDLSQVFYPESVAVVGASDRNVRYYVEAMVEAGKLKVFVVNPNYKEVLGIKSYASIADIPEKVDYVVVAVPATQTPSVLLECAKKGVKAVHIFTSGFSETGTAEGRALEEKLAEIAETSGFRIIGPNCMGIYCPESGLRFANDQPSEPGPVAFISQSGGRAVNLVANARLRNVRFSKVISYGNACDLDFVDFLEYLKDDPKTNVILGYVEGFKKTNGLLELLKETCMKKPVAILKGGVSEEGARAAAFHTGSLAGSARVWEGVCRQTGVIQVEFFEDLLDLAVGFMYAKLPEGRGVAIMTNSGGSSVVYADVCAKYGLRVPEFEEETQRRLRSFIPAAGSSVKNPLDAWMAFARGRMMDALDAAASDRNIHSLIIELQPENFHVYARGIDRRGDMAETAIASCRHVVDEHGKPVFIVVNSSYYHETERAMAKFFQDAGFPVFSSLQGAVKTISKMYWYKRFKDARG
ncbi:MAG: CoA-binding protein [Candidatus Jordarchaeales archaeon]|nr:CoA-binding protein [Candidatus Jordarchaeia archaeon]